MGQGGESEVSTRLNSRYHDTRFVARRCSLHARCALLPRSNRSFLVANLDIDQGEFGSFALRLNRNQVLVLFGADF